MASDDSDSGPKLSDAIRGGLDQLSRVSQMMDPLRGYDWEAQAARQIDTMRHVAERQEMLAGRHAAEEILHHLQERIELFQNRIADTDKEIGIQLANFGVAAQIHIRQLSAKNPNLIVFHGILEDGQDVCLVQHISQLNFLLIEVSPPKEAEPYRIGFR